MKQAPSEANHESSAGKPRRLRCVSYNVHACIGADGQFSPSRIATVLQAFDADFIALQELEDRGFQGQTVSSWLARNLDMRAFHGATLMRGDSAYGNLLLSRRSAQATRTHDITLAGREPRGVIDADFDLFDGRLRLLATHFGLTSTERRQQANALVDIASTGDASLTVLMGDFNEWRPGSYPRRRLSQVFDGVSWRRTWPARRPLMALDAIGIASRNARDVQMNIRAVTSDLIRGASDHLPVVCDLTLA